MAGTSININPKAKAQGFSARFVCLSGNRVQDQRHSVRLQIIHNGKIKRYSTKEACTLDQWDEAVGRVRARVKGATLINGILSAIESQVAGIVDTLIVSKALSLENFDVRYRNPKGAEDIISFLGQVEKKLRAEGRFGYSICFRNAASAIRRSSSGRAVRFSDITASSLDALEQFLRSEGCTNGGIATYMRVLKVAVNLAIKEGLLHRDLYPFETAQSRGYSLKRLKTRYNPRALTDADMEKLKRFPFDEHPHLTKSVRLFLFSYYARGINFSDIAQLRHSDVYDGRIVYRRRKTGDAFSIPISEPLAEIMAAVKENAGPYLFPILGERHQSVKQQWDRIQKCLRQMNGDLKQAARVVGIDVHLTSYVARHTFATRLKRQGVDVAVISESMGHESVDTTRAYLKRFGSEVLDAADALL